MGFLERFVPPAMLQRLRSLVQVDGNGRVLLLAGAAVAIAVIAAVALWSWGSGYSVLYAGLSGEEGGRTIAELQKLNIPYRITEGGRVIMVPSADAGRARLQLAARGVPKHDANEWALLDNQSLGVSPFVEQVHYVRAIESALSRTIRDVDGVASAKVTLALPKPTAFLADAPKPSASVMVRLRPGTSLSYAQVDGMVGLVASSVPGLARDNVTIVDQTGRGLTAGGKEAMQQVPHQLELARDINRRYETLVTDLLVPVLGRGNFRVSADADIDFSQSKESLVKYGESHVLSQDETVHTRPADMPAIGVPGALSNRPPDNPTIAPPQPAPQPPQAQPQSQGQAAAPAGEQPAAPAPPRPMASDTHKTTNFDIDKTVQFLEHPSWKLHSINVAVLVNNPSGSPLPPARLDAVRRLVASAVGAGENPKITVVDLPFEDPNTSFAESSLPWWKEPWMAAVQHNMMLALAGLLALFGGVFPMLRRTAASQTAWVAAATEARRSAAANTNDADWSNAAAALAQRRTAAAEGKPGTVVQDVFSIEAETVRTLVTNDPARTAQVLKGWIAGDRHSFKQAS